MTHRVALFRTRDANRTKADAYRGALKKTGSICRRDHVPGGDAPAQLPRCWRIANRHAVQPMLPGFFLRCPLRVFAEQRNSLL